MIQPLWKREWKFLKKQKIELPYDPAFPLLSIYLEKTIINKRHIHPNAHCNTFTIAKTQKQPKYPLVEEWIKKTWYVCTMEHYSVITRSFVETWMDIEAVIQSEVRQKEKNKYFILTYICGI